MPSREQFLSELAWSDVVYFTGGDTPRLVSLMKKLGVTSNLLESFTKDKVACGISAGTLCFFSKGQSDTQSYNLKRAADKWQYATVKGWGLIPAYGGVHYNRFHPQTGSPRSLDYLKSLERMKKGTVGLTVTNQAAWQFDSGSVNIIDSESTGQGFRIIHKGKRKLDITSFATSDGSIPVQQLLGA